MNPDKLFDYLDGKLRPNERAELEERLMSDQQLRRELTIARQIHGETGDSREIVGIADPILEERGAVLGRRVAIAFAVLVFANVVFGVYAVAFMKMLKVVGIESGAIPNSARRFDKFSKQLG